MGIAGGVGSKVGGEIGDIAGKGIRKLRKKIGFKKGGPLAPKAMSKALSNATVKKTGVRVVKCYSCLWTQYSQMPIDGHPMNFTHLYYSHYTEHDHKTLSYPKKERLQASRERMRASWVSTWQAWTISDAKGHKMVSSDKSHVKVTYARKSTTMTSIHVAPI